jgi:hypothetical protein
MIANCLQNHRRGKRSMLHARDVRGLRRYMLLGQIVSVLMGLAGLVPIGLFFDPAILGIGAKQQADYRGQSLFLMVGIGFVCFALFFVVIFTFWSQRLLWIWQNTIPVPMNLSINIHRGMDSTTYDAILRFEASGKKDWIVGLYSPSWPQKDLQSLQNQTICAKVYFDPKSQHPAVIETELGLLWAMAGRSALSVQSNYP